MDNGRKSVGFLGDQGGMIFANLELYNFKVMVSKGYFL